MSSFEKKYASAESITHGRNASLKNRLRNSRMNEVVQILFEKMNNDFVVQTKTAARNPQISGYRYDVRSYFGSERNHPRPNAGNATSKNKHMLLQYHFVTVFSI